MAKDIPRIAPLPAAEWSREEWEAFEVISSPATAEAGARSVVATVLARHPALAKAFYTLGRHLLIESTLPGRLRELVTLRVTRRYPGGVYDWHHHVRFARQMGFTEEELTALQQPLDAMAFEGVERLVLQAADELCDDHTIGDATWAALARELGTDQIMDLVYTVGLYAMTSWAKDAFKIAIEPEFRSDHEVLPPITRDAPR